ncbi:hypothetical protein GQF42_00900 [Streptomyces broussonetiae]|uniref:Uncharacterized protein n=1 Tax=Streptomyces broussonetiae TaxID=2686304 RepID=A0A6I6MPG4_9ACTN|nr:hypothetical protein [Streptomyces broussonetiae]QHA02103.1 hypothetical protein GQF42_00900 [Streptomyces broussonetiae]
MRHSRPPQCADADQLYTTKGLISIRVDALLEVILRALAAEPDPAPPGHAPSLLRRFIDALACRPPSP